MDQPSAAEAAVENTVSSTTQQAKGILEHVPLSAAAPDASSLSSPPSMLDPREDADLGHCQCQSQFTLLSSTEAVSSSPSDSSSYASRRPRLEAHEQVLRLRACEIAAVAGFHPFKDLLELLEEHIYQDLPQLQGEDYAVCDLVLISKEQEFEHLAHQAGPQAAAALRKIHAGSMSATVQTTRDVDQIKMDMGKALRLAAAGGRVAEAGITVLRNHLTHMLSTAFGKRHEDSAIELYESRHGVKVHSQNERMLTWWFPQDPGGVSLETPPPLDIKRLRERREVREGAAAAAKVGGGKEGGGSGLGEGGGAEVEYSVVAVGDQDSSAKVQPSPKAMSSSKSSFLSSSEQHKQHDHHPRSTSRATIRGPDAWFRVCGVVDGLTETLDASHDDPNAWQMRTTVVEMKNRVAVRNVRDPPPFHDTLQLVTYMLMVDGANGGGGTTWGDLVQVVRGRGKGGGEGELEENEDEGEEEDGGGGGFGVSRMTTTRVALDEEQLQHGPLFFAHVVPRLYAYTNFVYSLRHDAGARRKFLLADEEEKWEWVVKHLDFWPRKRPQFNYGHSGGGDDGSTSGRLWQQLRGDKRRQNKKKTKKMQAARGESSSSGHLGVLHEQKQSQSQPQRKRQRANLHGHYELRSQQSMVTRSTKRKSNSPMPGGGERGGRGRGRGRGGDSLLV